MSDPFLGEIKLFAYNRVPSGWMPCDGALLPVSQYAALFSLLGTTYGGNGSTNFGLPDLRGRVPIHPILGQTLFGGAANVTLTEQQMPNHTHEPRGTAAPANTPSPKDHVWATQTANAYAGTPNAAMRADAIGGVAMAGSPQPHPNMQPSEAFLFCIATMGIYPSRS